VQKLLLVVVGGALGSGARYLVGLGALAAFGPALPAGTFLVNTVGSFLIAVVMRLFLGGRLVSERARIFLATGVMGGFTTYSSFSVETLRFLAAERTSAAFLYVGATVFLCLLAGILGEALARAILVGQERRALRQD
jgi:fluoride exporter